MAALWEKCFRMKQGLHWWSRHVFGDIFQRVRDAESRLDEAKMEYDLDLSPARREHLHQTGETLTVHEEIQGSAVFFFQDLLSAPAQTAGPISPDIIPSLITQEDNQELNRPPSLAKLERQCSVLMQIV
ncbi:Uncharacterized protein Adt_14516 [Abeliophyllum distichum]|uniref:Uncharacterized protein n=1 Tax=Abeliophyllum distichum TaxID=126358 RepID=A0ABD1TZX0_9LAMI